MQGITMQGISKEFGGKWALQGIDIFFRSGTIHAIVGENGAGKSTLMNILSGTLQPTTGNLIIDGMHVSFRNPQEASASGIGMVHQHFMLIPTLRVWQNAILGIEPGNKIGCIDKRAAIKMIEEACKEYDLELNPEQIVGTLTVGEQQRIEILKVMIRRAKIIIFDEPTSVLTPKEIEKLLENIKNLKRMDKTIIFISHKLEEVMDIADEITVLRLGEITGTLLREQADPNILIKMMVGRNVDTRGLPLKVEVGNPLLCVDNICTRRSQYTNGLDHVSFELNEGEVLGIAGVDGNGQTELVQALFGLEKVTSGSINKSGVDLTKLSSASIRLEGLALIAPDRQKQGLVMDSSILRNIILGCEGSKRINNGIFFRNKALKSVALELAKQYDVRMAGLESNVSELSGGNQQKVILAREFDLREADLIVAVNPTRGLDVGAIEFVYQQIEQQKQKGKGILLISTELSEILRLSDRIAVFFRGSIMGMLSRGEATNENIGMLMTGVALKKEVHLI